LLSACSLELGGAFAKTLFAPLGPAGTVILRVGLAAGALLLRWRPRVRGHSWRSYWVVILFGLSIAAMNLTFYLTLNRVPLAEAVTLEFVGPLGIAIAGSKRPQDLVWAVLAAAGVLAFAPLGTNGHSVADPIGIALGLLSGGFCASYILLSSRTGRIFADGSGLALAMTVAAIVLMPLGISAAGRTLLTPRLLAAGFAVAMLSSVLPESFELRALRRLPTHVFGILVSLEPALAALAGWLVLHERLGLRALITIALVTAASIGASRSQ
jgi:inner membrane transporter RhtA